MAMAAAERPMTGSSSLQRKRSQVHLISQELLSHRVVGVVAFRGVPAAALQSMRRELRSRGSRLRVAPNTLLTHALTEASVERPALKELIPLVRDQSGLLFSELNPFMVYQELEQTRQPTYAHGGEVAPADVKVPAGETSFKPGPIVGELQHAGLPAAIEKGKVVLKKDTVLVPRGQVISREVAQILTRLEVKPLEVGLILQGAAEGSFFYPRETLAVDLVSRRNDLARAHVRALTLAVRIGWTTPETAPRLVTRGHREALALAVAAAYPTPESVAPLLRKAYREALAMEGLKKD
jgi:large subunit ribosomal protein L10